MLKVRETCTLGCPLVRRLAGIKEMKVKTITTVSYTHLIAGSPLTTSYQFYGTRDKVDDRSVNDLYDGTAWLQALTFGYRAADVVDLRLEGTWVKAEMCIRDRYYPPQE